MAAAAAAAVAFSHDHGHHAALDTLVYGKSKKTRETISSLRFSNVVVFLSTVVGRDKLYKLLQSGAKLWSWLLVQRSHHDPGVAQDLLIAASGFSAGRRFLRVGHLPGAIDGLRVGLQADTGEYYYAHFAALSRFFGVLFLLVDNFGWFARMGVFKPLPSEKEGFLQSICATGNTGFQILADVSSYLKLEARRKQVVAMRDSQLSSDDVAVCNTELRDIEARHDMLQLSFWKNGLDLPPTANGIFEIPFVPAGVWNSMVFASACFGVYQGLVSSKASSTKS
jgi:hypothetical protein